MKWPAPLVKGILIKRYKRFLADFRLADGRVVTAHCANTGSMKTCMAEGIEGWLTYHDDPKRKLAYSWQVAVMPDGPVGINTSLANGLVEEAIRDGMVPALTGYDQIRRERKYGVNSRIDLLLSGPDRPDCYVEVKNVTLLLSEGEAAFPDAVTQRGAKHLDELVAMVEAGNRAVLFYCVQRVSANRVTPAEAYDPHYAASLRLAVSRGLEVMAHTVTMDEAGLAVAGPLPVILAPAAT